MTEADITQTLQAQLNRHRLRAVAKLKQNHLHVLLTRPPGSADITDFKAWCQQVLGCLRGLQLPEINLVTVYLRVAGQKSKDYEFEETHSLDEPLDERSATTIHFSSEQMASYMKQLDAMAASVDKGEEEIATEFYQPGSSRDSINRTDQTVAYGGPPPISPPVAPVQPLSLSSNPFLNKWTLIIGGVVIGVVIVVLTLVL
ncbi:MAG: hypothetical protein HC921_12515 [Synechococcaceae cyanobacterium SM2_3_1]|nr:hypothetical protein [Synechococcaceae cyanobacterium SM2_3_1]